MMPSNLITELSTMIPTHSDMLQNHSEQTSGASTPHNGTRDAFDEFVRCLTLFTCICGVIGNGIVLWLLSFHIKRTPFSFYVLSLAASDFTYLFLEVIWVINYLLYRPNFQNIVNLLTNMGLHVTFTVGLGLLASISSQRCLSILFPIWYRNHHPKRGPMIVCSILWIMSLLLNPPKVYYCVVQMEVLPPSGCDLMSKLSGTLMLSLLLLMTLSSLILFIRILWSAKRYKPKKLVILILLTVSVFLLCAVPHGINHSVFNWRALYNHTFHEISYFLSCVNSSANPLIYFFIGSLKHQRLKEPLRVVLQRALRDDSDLTEDRATSSRTDTTLDMPS
ncbi:mas-related G-protein coupled receptor member D-like [Gracilinanus agilis]|uniref:mas-related G-protein coupled receptor member D-like n=1 Tax=Gracilinanus agilis TaxID=191870 RepID=UPI001CFC5563|nr:mas-related G-protein coupled receptor member D-like [Gracilinanus agilis]